MTIAIDGTPATGNSSGATTTASLTTSSSNDIIVVAAITNGGLAGGTGGFSSVSDTVNGNYAKHASAWVTGTQYAEIWWVLSPTALSGVTVTVTPNSANFTTMLAFGVKGANTSSPWDSASPVTGGVAAGETIATANANDLVFTCYVPGTTGGGAGSGWTLLSAAAYANFDFVEYQIVSSTGSYQGTLTGDTNAVGAIAAMKAAAAGGIGVWPYRM